MFIGVEIFYASTPHPRPGAVAENSYPTIKVRGGGKRSYSTFKVRRGSHEEIPLSKVTSSGCTLLEQP